MDTPLAQAARRKVFQAFCREKEVATACIRRIISADPSRHQASGQLLNDKEDADG
ncbi:MAG TPA: hypothetical protein VFY73_29120 [Ideonella sp.]|uniref:hypothetical protein n=1 Tax=Ideonella sp. TaxID=1929293 RepID=UPI002E314110|nr:hypothetical protein [Ideonella sp.]HEX5688100.1 hypothetical protein [Ideonella sp.]